MPARAQGKTEKKLACIPVHCCSGQTNYSASAQMKFHVAFSVGGHVKLQCLECRWRRRYGGCARIKYKRCIILPVNAGWWVWFSAWLVAAKLLLPGCGAQLALKVAHSVASSSVSIPKWLLMSGKDFVKLGAIIKMFLLNLLPATEYLIHTE